MGFEEGLLVAEVVFVDAQTCDFKQDPPVLLIPRRVKALQKLLNQGCWVIRNFSVEIWRLSCQVVVRDHVLVREVYGTALARKVLCLVEETRDSVHLNDVLDVLLQTQALQGYLELFVLLDTRLKFFRAATAPQEATANAIEEADEKIGTEVDFELAPSFEVGCESLSGISC